MPADLLAEVRENKADIIRELRAPGDNDTDDATQTFRNPATYGDGKLPPLRHPPGDETELRRLIDHLADPVAFAACLEWAMTTFDPAEPPI